MICTSRDAKLIETIGRYGVLSSDLVAEMFFPETALTTVRRRLRHLEKAGLVYRLRGLDHGAVAWALSNKTAQKLGFVYSNRQFSRNSIAHDVALSRVRNVLERIGLGETWVPEYVLKRQAMMKRGRGDHERPFVPDAILTVKQKGEARVVALEVELSGKHRKRYEAILGRYKGKKTLWAVWYLVPTEAVGKTLEQVWRNLNGGKRNDMLMWSLLESMMSDAATVMIRSEHFSTPLRQLFQTKEAALAPALRQSRGIITTTATAQGAVL